MSNILNLTEPLETIIVVLVRVVLAVLVGALIGMERGRQGRAAGMRTHVLVSLGATLTALTGMYAYYILGIVADPLRVSAQVISGIGFLGVGTILIKGRFQITGLTTAAGLWTVAATGLAIGIGFYTGALVVFLCAILCTTLMHKLEYSVKHHHTRLGVYIEISSDEYVGKIVDHIRSTYKAFDIQVTAARSGTAGNVGIEAIIISDGRSLDPDAVTRELSALDEVVFAIESI